MTNVEGSGCDAAYEHDMRVVARHAVTEALRRALQLARTDYQHNPTEAIIRTADELGVTL